MGKMIDITGQKFGKLTALEPTRTNSNRLGWKCRCDCGKTVIVEGTVLRAGKTKSCGCRTKELIGKANTKNLSGKKFGHLTALEPTERRSGGSIVWKCQCDCGNITYVIAGNLTSGHTKSCGCGLFNNLHPASLDLIGKKFYNLTVVKKLPSKNNETRWLCKCECGNMCEAIGWHLTSGVKGSCGCLKSKGESKIQKILSENNISFETQKTFDNCVFPDSNKKAFFDFYVNNEYLIEYNGEQHYGYRNVGWSTEEQYLKTKEHDDFKKKWCKDNNIPLIIIPFWKFDVLSLEDLLLRKGK